MEDLAVFTAQNHSGSFGKNFVKFQKNKYVMYQLRVSQFFTIRTSQPENNIYLLPHYVCNIRFGNYSVKFRDKTTRTSLEDRLYVSISVSGQLPTYSSTNPTLTLTCCQLTVVELREGQVGSCPDTDIDPTVPHEFAEFT